MKKILLGITGGIAAYKSAELLRCLQRSGAEVRVVMSEAAARFVTPLTFQALSGYPVCTDLFTADSAAGMDHIELSRWADIVLIAPATADFMAKLATGQANDVVTTVCLARSVPLFIAPAMNQWMWSNIATQDNCTVLRQRGVTILDPTEGVQACGDVGFGRMLEPQDIMQRLVENDSMRHALAGVRTLVTAGPTREPIDPVRYISNRSSGKMGYELAAALHDYGAEVVLVSGPVALETPLGVSRIQVETAQDMHQAVQQNLKECDIFIAAAAVSDYRPRDIASNKIKKSKKERIIPLVLNPDVLAEGVRTASSIFSVGFAAETEHMAKYARLKLEKKQLDMIAANDVSIEGQGFDSNQNALTVIWQGGEKTFPLMAKRDLAKQLVALIIEKYNEKSRSKNS
ncbi:MAG: bifunctional phosphopantothenoylcysteine decarboxylase/phosphopantothenate--cysteine ligase CoaBC [Gammaproteobacteria bacterium]|nr:bifunctional phosphopantothenoylcysteine decarboxylase/phosphopantothenate--cysteine ligase CoaBC [Gammaproteobacteria bacterium]